jgi:hypothetical protein
MSACSTFVRVRVVRRRRATLWVCLDPLPDCVDIERARDPKGSGERPSSHGEFEALRPRMQVRPSTTSPALLIRHHPCGSLDDQTQEIRFRRPFPAPNTRAHRNDATHRKAILAAKTCGTECNLAERSILAARHARPSATSTQISFHSVHRRRADPRVDAQELTSRLGMLGLTQPMHRLPLHRSGYRGASR